MNKMNQPANNCIEIKFEAMLLHHYHAAEIHIKRLKSKRIKTCELNDQTNFLHVRKSQEAHSSIIKLRIFSV